MPSNIRITELDFDSVKREIIEYLKSQDEFSDYDFTGSGWNVLLDVLALNTHYNAYLANMLVNEKYSDSAVKRSSLVSIAKHLGYTPRSAIGSVAHVSMVVNNPIGNPLTLTLDRFTSFTTSIEGQSFTFVNLEPYTIEPQNGTYRFDNVKLKEGRITQFQHVVFNPGSEEKYIIPHENIDLSTLQVVVQNSATNINSETFINSGNDISGLTSESKVYFVEESPLGQYQLYFGDGIIGKRLVQGNVIKLRYLIASGQISNVSSQLNQQFTINTSVGGSNDINLSTISNSTGGADRESLESIRFNAPKSFSAQHRAITEIDYDYLIRSAYSDVESVSVWGGADNVPPIYGKVFIALKPATGFVIDDITKSNIKTFIISQKQMLTVIPEFVDPDYLFIGLNCAVEYNKDNTPLSASEISTLTREIIEEFFTTELRQFNRRFLFSKFLELLNNVHPSVNNVLVDISIKKFIVPALNVSNSFIDANALRYNNIIIPGSVESTVFFIVHNLEAIQVILKDDGQGNLRLYNFLTNEKLNIVGVVDYDNGLILINNIVPVGYPSNQFDIQITIKPRTDNLNINAQRGQILLLDEATSNAISNRKTGLIINSVAV